MVGPPKDGSALSSHGYVLLCGSTSQSGDFDGRLQSLSRPGRHCVSFAHEQLPIVLLWHDESPLPKLFQPARSTPACPENCRGQLRSLLFRGWRGKHAWMGLSILVETVWTAKLENISFTALTDQSLVRTAPLSRWSFIQRRGGLLLRNWGLESFGESLLWLSDRCECDWAAWRDSIHFQWNERDCGKKWDDNHGQGHRAKHYPQRDHRSRINSF